MSKEVKPIRSFYMASSFKRKEEAMATVRTLQAGGIMCTSRWLEEGRKNSTYGTDAKYSKEDLEDVARADAMVQLVNDPLGNETRGGRHTELGVALILQKPVFLIGEEREQVFHYATGVKIRETVHQVLAEISAHNMQLLSGFVADSTQSSHMSEEQFHKDATNLVENAREMHKERINPVTGKPYEERTTRGI